MNHVRRATFIKLAAGLLFVLLLVVAYRLLWTSVEPKVEHRIAEIGLTENEVAANGPLPGDVSVYAKELAEAQQHASPGYYPSINGAELTDSERSGLFSAASFTGSFDGGNRVLAWRSEDSYQGASYLNTRKPARSSSWAATFRPWRGPFPRDPSSPKLKRLPESRSGAPTSTTPTPPEDGSGARI